MQNMKLLDLQTGKYLELGKHWLYGEKYIYVFYGRDEGYDDERDGNGYYKSEPQEPLKTLCEEMNAVVYRDRYVLFELGECDDYNSIFEEYSKSLRNEPNKFEELMKLIK